MSKAPKLPNEEQRQAALDSLRILDTPPEAAFDDVMRLVAQLCQAPMAGITMVDRDRQWMKAAPPYAPRQMPRDHGFCGHAIAQTELMEIPDALLDDRFRDGPMVTGPSNVRFYAGAPLILSTGEAMGTLCVLDHQPRRLTELQARALCVLAQGVVAHLELRSARLLNPAQAVPVELSATFGRTPAVGPILNLSVLLVDDVVINQKVMRAVLLPHRADVHAASSGEEAIELFAQRKFDLVLMDRYMPGLDGLETTRLIRELDLRRGTQTPIFGTSASVSPEDRAQFLAAGANDTLAKPLRVEELWAKLNYLRMVARVA